MLFCKLVASAGEKPLEELKLTPLNKYHGLEFLYGAHNGGVREIDIILRSLEGINPEGENIGFAIDNLPLDIRHLLGAADAFGYVWRNLDIVIFCAPGEYECYAYQDNSYASGVVAGQYLDSVAQFKNQRIGFINPDIFDNYSAIAPALLLTRLAACKELQRLAHSGPLGKYAQAYLAYKELFNRYSAVIMLRYALRLFAKAGRLRLSYQDLKILRYIIEARKKEIRGYNNSLGIDAENLDPLPFVEENKFSRWLRNLLGWLQ